MRFTVNQKTFLRELDLLQSIPNRKTPSLPVLDNILIQVNQEGLILTASDTEVSMTTTCPVDDLNVEEGSFLLPAKRLRNLIAEYDNSQISFALQGNDRMKIACGRSVNHIAGQESTKFPTPAKIDEYTGAIPLTVLMGQIERVQFAIPDKPDGQAPKGALLRLKENVLTMAAADGVQMSVVVSNITFPDSIEAVLPESGVRELLKLLSSNDEKTSDGIVWIAKDENHVYFKVGDRTLNSALLAKPFPDPDKFKFNNINHVTLNASLFSRLIKRTSVMADERSPNVKLNIENNSLEITSGSEVGDSAEYMDCESNNVVMKIVFDSNNLLDCLNVSKTEKVRLEIKDSERPVVLRPLESEVFDWYDTLMPKRQL